MLFVNLFWVKCVSPKLKKTKYFYFLSNLSQTNLIFTSQTKHEKIRLIK